MRSDIKTGSRNALLMLAAMSALLVAVTLSSAQPGGKTSFTGVWETVAGSATRYSVELTQIGNRVTGTFTPGNGKIFGGVVVGNKLTFKWTQDPGASGTGEFTMDADGKGFAGSSTSVKPSPATHPWKTFDPGPPSSFAGTWYMASNNSGVRIPLTIVQRGAKVTGIYPTQNGKLEGTVAGGILRFKWESDKGSGSGRFTISSTGLSFTASFNKGDDNPDVFKPVWEGWGERTACGKSVITEGGCNGSDNGSGNGTIGGSGGETMASYAGSWLISESSVPGGMDLTQSGPTVTGYYATGRGAYELKDATVNGSILRFRLVPRTAKPGEMVGELRMEPDGKSFKGTVGKFVVTGTLRNP